MKRYLWIVLVLAMSNLAYGTTYYVSKSGSDSNSCGTATNPNGSNPKLTITNAIVNCAAPGNVIQVRSGTYNEYLSNVDVAVLNWPRGSSWDPSGSFLLQGYPGDTRPKIAKGPDLHYYNAINGQFPQYIHFDNLDIDIGLSGNINTPGPLCLYWTLSHFKVTNSELHNAGGVCVSGGGDDRDLANSGEDFTFQNNEVHNTYDALDTGNWPQPSCGCPVVPPGCPCIVAGFGMYISPHNSLITNNNFYNNSGYALHFYHGGGNSAIHDNIIANNTFWDNAFHDGQRGQLQSVIVEYGNNSLYYNNVFYHNMIAYPGARANIQFAGSGNRFYNNTVYNSDGFGIFNAGGNNTACNNIVYLHSKGEIFVEAGSLSTCGSNNLLSNPVFVDASVNNYHLQATSPAILNCMNFSSVFTADKDGLNRPSPGTNWACGAYEYASGGVPAAAQVEFGVQPSNTTANQTISPNITVRVENSSGALISTATDTVTLAVVSTQIPQGSLSVVSTDSAEGSWPGSNAIDGNTATAWHTQFTGGSPGHPHSIVVSFPSGSVNGIRYTPRPGPDTSGQIIGYNVYVSTDGTTWGTAVASGNFGTLSAGKTYGITFTPKTGSFLKLESTSSSGTPYASVAELNVMVVNSVIPNGTLTQAAVAGVATFSLNMPTAGVAYVLKATSGSLNSQLSSNFTINAPPPPPGVQPTAVLRFVPGR
jgi:hypothetical protein